MVKYLLPILLFLSPNVWAEWVYIAKTENGDSVSIDKNTIRMDGVRRTFWTMTNYSKLDNTGSQSTRNKYEIDCQKETINLLYITAFSKPMLSGEVLVNGAPTPKAAPIAPGTVVNKFQEIVCVKK